METTSRVYQSLYFKIDATLEKAETLRNRNEPTRKAKAVLVEVANLRGLA